MMSLRNRYAVSLLATMAAASLGSTMQANAQTSTASDTKRTQEVRNRSDALVAMKSNITVKATDARLEDLLAHFEAITPVRFEPAWATLDQAGLDPEQLVTLDLTDRPLIEALDRFVEQVGDDFDQAAWQIGIDGRVQIGPKSRLNERTEIVIYDLNDLIFEVPDFVDVPPIDLQSAMQQGEGSSQPPFRDSGNETRPEPTLRDADEIAELLTLFVEPEQWRRNGGEGALMQAWREQLMVRAPRYVLRQIGALATQGL